MPSRASKRICVRLSWALAGWLCFAGSLYSQTSSLTAPESSNPTATPVQVKSSSALPSANATPPPQATPLPNSTPFAVPALPGPSPAAATTPVPSASPPAVSLVTQTPNVNPLTLDEALRLANAQASSFVTAGLNERIAAEDVKQAQAAFLPKVTAPLSYIYTTPALGQKPGEQRALANEVVAAGSLRILVGYDFTRPISTADLMMGVPVDPGLQQFRPEDISRRPEFAQLEAQLRAAKLETRIARADRLPSLTYS